VRRALRPVRWPVVACLATLFLVAIPRSRAAEASVTTTDGSVISAWEVRVRGSASDAGVADPTSADASALYYSIADASGTLIGAVPPTSDATLDTEPTLAIDPRTGSVCLLWSRFDGVSFQIAYARLAGGVWTDFHFMTFGRAGGFEPRVGSSSTGTYLFWLDSTDRHFYAPMDLAAGRLLSAGGAIRVRPAGGTGGRTLQVGASAPIAPGGGHGSPGRRDILDPGTGSLEPEATDGPNPPAKNHSSFWRVHGSAGCRNLILVIPDATLPVVHVILFANGTTHEIGHAGIPASPPDRFADALAAAYMDLTCP
jgi:hypothetical protein